MTVHKVQPVEDLRELFLVKHMLLRKTDRTLSKGEDVVVCLPGAR